MAPAALLLPAPLRLRPPPLVLALVLVLLGASWAAPLPAELSPLEKEREIKLVVQVHADMEALRAVEPPVDMDRSIPMAGQAGQPFVCFAPRGVAGAAGAEEADAAGKQEDTATAGAAAAAAEDPLDAEVAKQAAVVESQLGTLRGGCFVQRMGYWSYKVCPFQSVEQIHFEGNINKMSFSLGTFTRMERRARAAAAAADGAADSKKKDGAEAAREAKAAPSLEQSEWVQHFEGGTGDRKTELVFTCRLDIDTMQVESIEEQELHKYVVHVSTPLACLATPEWQAKQLLSALRGQCFRKERKGDWWTYEFCFERHLRQFHKEQDGRVTEYILGEFDARANLKLEKDLEFLTKERGTNQPVLKQVYLDGTRCDLTNEYRSTEVYFSCSATPGNAAAPHDALAGPGLTSIVSVTESSSCHYVVKINTPLLCAHPFFRESGTATKEASVEKIHCLPASALERAAAEATS